MRHLVRVVVFGLCCSPLLTHDPGALAGVESSRAVDSRKLEARARPSLEAQPGFTSALSRDRALSNSAPSRPAPRSRPEGFRLPELRPLPSAYVGTDHERAAFDPSLARPTALAAGDFDEDGVPDLVSGYATNGGGGVLTLHRGNVDAIYPNNAGAHRRRAAGSFTDAPFLTPARVFSVAEAPDFLTVGDFDADGHQDIALASRGGRRIHLYAGDGRGAVNVSRSIELPGPVSALVAGEINRRDGLTDLVVGIAGPEAPAVLVFEGPQGALRSEPEVVQVGATPTALALGRLDEGSLLDLAVAAGREVLLVRGRDRQFPQADEAAAAEPTVAEVIVRSESAIDALAWADLAWDAERRQELALLTRDGRVALHRFDGSTLKWKQIDSRSVRTAGASGETAATRPQLLDGRVSGLPMRELIVVDPDRGRLVVTFGEVGAENEAIPRSSVSAEIAGGVAAVLPMRLDRDGISDLVVLAPGAGAPSVSASLAGGAGAGCSTPGSICVNTATDGFTASDGLCTLHEAIRNAYDDSDASGGDCAAGSGADVIEFDIPGPGPHVIVNDTQEWELFEPVTIDGYSQPGAVSNSVAAPGATDAVLQVVLRQGASPFRGMVAGFGNPNGSVIRGLVFQGFLDGITIENTSDIIVEGCYVGTDTAGTTDFGQQFTGIVVANTTASVIGGTPPAARNVISGNDEHGVLVESGSSGITVLGNYIGIDKSGLAGLGNDTYGVYVADSNANTVGGALPGAGNAVSANDVGVAVGASTADLADDNLVQGNLIGLDAAGLAGLGNNYGILVSDVSGTLVGGPSPGARNVISANSASGVLIQSAMSDPVESTNNRVQGNYIGTDASGLAALGNAFYGVWLVDAPSNLIGGPGAGNVLSANEEGVFIQGAASTANRVEDNSIGTDANGLAALGNALYGVWLVDAPSNRIGGPGVGNLISGNDSVGVVIEGVASTGNRVEDNSIGTAVGGVGSVPNSAGVAVVNASFNSIGGKNPGEGNLISGNTGAGVILLDAGFPTVDNEVLGNRIYGNGGIGIDLANDGATPNDGGDVDTGANDLQNYPELTAAEIGLSDVVLAGSLDSVSGTYRVEFFSGASCASAERYLGHADLSAGAIATSVAARGVLAGEFISTTATSPSGDTSEFGCLAITDCAFQAFGPTLWAQDQDTLTWSPAADVRFVRGSLSAVGSYATIEEGSLTAATTLDISADNPSPGAGLYYLVRDTGCGSWQTLVGAEPGRDSAVDIVPVCGDGILDAGEICDDGGDSLTCDANCTPARCGDGDLNPVAGESCDDGNTDDPDGVTDFCTGVCTRVRYFDNQDGSVADGLTGLIWLRDASCSDIPITDGNGRAPWGPAVSGVAALASGTCGLTDGSIPGEWRLPTKVEWETTIADAVALGCTGIGGAPAITNLFGTGCHADGPPAFVDVIPDYHWSSTEEANFTADAVYLSSGSIGAYLWNNNFLVWPVRDDCGNGIATGGEMCDDGNQTNGDGCDDDVSGGGDCTVSACGNGVVAGSEECDDANGIDLDGCGNDCTVSCVPTPTQRFRDNGDGTISDRQTCLMWEKKTGTLGTPVHCSTTTCPDPHDVNNTYQWSLGSPWNPDGGAFTDFLVKLNAGAGFAGYTDWRLPTSAGCCGFPTGQPAELESIVETGHGAPTINPIFGATASGNYWSSSAFSGFPDFAWFVYFDFGTADGDFKGRNYYVRAVRGGP